MPDELHFYAEGLLYLEKDEKVDETKLQCFLSTNYISNINISLKNIRPVTGIVQKLNRIEQKIED